MKTVMRSADEEADLSSADNGPLEMDQPQHQGFWDPLAFLQTFCTHRASSRNQPWLENTYNMFVSLFEPISEWQMSTSQLFSSSSS